MLCWINKRFVFARDKPDTQKISAGAYRDLKGLTTSKVPELRENAADQVTRDFSFVYDWFKAWYAF